MDVRFVKCLLSSLFRCRVLSFVPLLLLLGSSSDATLVTGVVTNFDGSDNSNTLITPADSNGAIGPLHFVEFINGFFAVYNKTTGEAIRRISDTQFWNNAGVSPSTVADPRTIYDPISQRWFASQVDFDGSAQDPTFESNDFLLAVSDTSDPLGSWHAFSFVADPTAVHFADFPTLGVDSNAVYISGDMFHGENNPLGSVLVSIPKTDLLASPPVITNRSFQSLASYSVRGQVLQPAVCLDGSASGIVLATTDILGESSLKLSRVLNSGGTNATMAPATTLVVPSYTAPLDATQPDGTATVAVNDARFSAKAYVVKGIIYAVHNVEVNSRAAIRWYRIDAASQTVLESGTIADSNLDLFFPSIAANTNGTMVIGCNGSSIDTLVSCYAIVGETVNGVTTFGNLMLLATGGDVYHDLFEQIGFSDDSRWGDYSATMIDPVDPTRFWLINMVPLDAETWVTQISQVLAAPVRLNIAAVGTNARLSGGSWRSFVP